MSNSDNRLAYNSFCRSVASEGNSWVAEYGRHDAVYYRPEGALHLLYLPREISVVEAARFEAESAQRTTPFPHISNAEKKALEPAGADAAAHRVGIVATRMGQTKPVMAVPFTQMDQTVRFAQIIANAG